MYFIEIIIIKTYNIIRYFFKCISWEKYISSKEYVLLIELILSFIFKKNFQIFLYIFLHLIYQHYLLQEQRFLLNLYYSLQ